VADRLHYIERRKGILNKGVFMKRQIAVKPILRKVGALLSLMLVLMGLLTTQARAQVSVNVNIGPPAPVIVQAPPEMLFLRDPGVYVAVGIPYDVFFLSGRYYYFHANHWFWGPGYGGPWTYVEYRTLPPGLRKYKVVELRDYREREYKVYKVQGRNFHGEHFYAVAGDDDDHGPGNGHGKGNGKGKKH
jgi:hypothetical protein